MRAEIENSVSLEYLPKKSGARKLVGDNSLEVIVHMRNVS